MSSTEKEYRNVLAFFVSLPADDRLNLLYITKPRSAAVLHRMYDILSQASNQASIAFYFDGIQQVRTVKNYGDWTPSMEPSLEKLKFFSSSVSTANFELEFELERVLRLSVVDDVFVPFELLEFSQDAEKIFDMLYNLAPFVTCYDRPSSRLRGTQYFTPLTFVASLMMKNILDRYSVMSKKGITQPARCSTMSDGPNVRNILARLRQFSKAELNSIDFSFTRELLRRCSRSISDLPTRSVEQDTENFEVVAKGLMMKDKENGWEKVNSWAKQWSALDPRLEQSQVSAAATPLGVASPVEDEDATLIPNYLSLVLSTEKLRLSRSMIRREIFSSFKRGPHVENFACLADCWHCDQELYDVSCLTNPGGKVAGNILSSGCKYADTLMHALVSFPLAYSAFYRRHLHKETQFTFAEMARDVLKTTRPQALSKDLHLSQKSSTEFTKSILWDTSSSRLCRGDKVSIVHKDADRESHSRIWGGVRNDIFSAESSSAGAPFDKDWNIMDKIDEVRLRSEECLGQTAQQMDEASLAYESMAKKSYLSQQPACQSPFVERNSYKTPRSSRRKPVHEQERDLSDSSIDSMSSSSSSSSSSQLSEAESLNVNGPNGDEDEQVKPQDTSIMLKSRELDAPGRDRSTSPQSPKGTDEPVDSDVENQEVSETAIGKVRENVSVASEEERDEVAESMAPSLKSDISAAKAAENASGIMFSASNDTQQGSDLLSNATKSDIQDFSKTQCEISSKISDKTHKASSKRLAHYNPLRPEHHCFASMPDDRKSVTRRLHSEIVELLNQVYPTNSTRTRRQRIVDLVDEAVKSCWEGAHVEVYGSFSTDLYLPHSDVDVLVIGAKEWSIESKMKHLASRLKSMPWCRYMRSIENTSVPVIKLSADVSKISLNEGRAGSAGEGHEDSDMSDSLQDGGHARGYSPHNISVDITFHGCSRMRSPVAFRDFVRKELARYEIIKPLGFIFKYFLYKLGLNDAYTGGLSSHSAILLLIFYFNLEEVSKAYTESKIPGSSQEIPADCKYGEWLLRFFQWVAEFPYKHVGISFGIGDHGVTPYFISVSNFGQGLIKLRQYDPSLPEDPDDSKGTFDRLFIGDPTDVSINVANSSFQWFLVQLSIQGAFKVLSDHQDTAPHLRIYGGVSESPSPLQNIFDPAVVQAAGKLRMAAKNAPR